MKKSIHASLLAMLLVTLCLNVAYAQDNKDEKIYSYVTLENPPTYPGGIVKFYNFLGENIKYPKSAVENKLQGTVAVSFVIEKDGSLTDVKTIGKKLGDGLDEEAVRVLELSKRWNPGMQDGKPIRVKYHIPVKFSLKK